MTEQEWLQATDPWLIWLMLEYLQGKASERKLRLFAAACCRRIWHLLTDERSRRAVEAAEQFADGLITRENLKTASQQAWASRSSTWESRAQGAVAVWTARESIDPQILKCLVSVMEVLNSLAVQAANYEGESQDGEPTSATLLHCILGIPSRPIVIPPAVLAWHDAVVVRLAQAAYEDRLLPAGTLDNGRLAVLADALEEAGCTEADILGHLRGPGPHVRGCWPVDLCLGRS